MQDGSLLDAELVSELQEIMGQNFQMLVESFRRDGEQRLAAMEKALEAEDKEALRRQAHSLKGSSSNLGAVRVVDVCVALELAVSNRELANVPVLLECLKQQFRQACTALQACLA